jgi:hypothetical protein
LTSQTSSLVLGSAGITAVLGLSVMNFGETWGLSMLILLGCAGVAILGRRHRGQAFEAGRVTPQR